MGRPKFTPKQQLPFDVHHPHLIHPSSTDPTHHPKGHLDPLSWFDTIHFLDSQTHRPTDGIGDRSIPRVLPLAILIESDGLKIYRKNSTGTVYRPLVSPRRPRRKSTVLISSGLKHHGTPRTVLSKQQPFSMQVSFVMPG